MSSQGVYAPHKKVVALPVTVKQAGQLDVRLVGGDLAIHNKELVQISDQS